VRRKTQRVAAYAGGDLEASMEQHVQCGFFGAPRGFSLATATTSAAMSVRLALTSPSKSPLDALDTPALTVSYGSS